MRDVEVPKIRKFGMPGELRNQGQKPVEVNSAGMLADRLTILRIQEWCLRNNGSRNAGKADALYESQTKDVIGALALASPGSSAACSKITNRTGNTSAPEQARTFVLATADNLSAWAKACCTVGV
jgi:hypothetical protein